MIDIQPAERKDKQKGRGKGPASLLEMKNQIRRVTAELWRGVIFVKA
jgi:hypothetical protein